MSAAAGHDAESHLDQRTPEDSRDDTPPAGAQSHADADLARALRHDERQHRVDSGEVEDHDDLRSFFRDALRLAGFHVEEAANGIQALPHLDNHPPDLVVLDLRLPVLSGVDIRRELAAQIQTRQIPIVVVTGSPEDLPADVAVDCVLTKPVEAGQLIETIRRCLAKS